MQRGMGAGTMTSDFDPWLSSAVALEVAMTTHAGEHAWAQQRATRLASLLANAVRESKLYRELYHGIDLARTPLHALPSVNKAWLMQRFEHWITDPAIRLDELFAFMADPSRIGEPYLDHYVVWQSSGSSGAPGVFVQDPQALAVFDALEALRRPAPASWTQLWDPWSLGQRIAFVGATEGHFASIASIRRLRRLNQAAPPMCDVSFLQPLKRLLRELEGFQPTVLATYPSEALALAQERVSGRLHIDLQQVWTGGETLTAATRAFVQDAFHCPVLDSYGASEFLSIASQCEHGRLHVNADWVILEPVDGDGKPVQPGEFGVTTLLTNLANRVQPLIRYDLGDQVAIAPDACACGSALPTVTVRGRCDDALVLPGHHGHRVCASPLALSTVLEEEAGLYDFQLWHERAGELQLCTPLAGSAARQTLQRARAALARYLAAQGAAEIEIHCRSGRAHRHGASGKVQRVVETSGAAPSR
jgi:phenylacetate-coenzyme A ligase PaaK-like adenylate-forming protein